MERKKCRAEMHCKRGVSHRQFGWFASPIHPIKSGLIHVLIVPSSHRSVRREREHCRLGRLSNAINPSCRSPVVGETECRQMSDRVRVILSRVHSFQACPSPRHRDGIFSIKPKDSNPNVNKRICSESDLSRMLRSRGAQFHTP